MLRDDGTSLPREIETRSTLRHDLMHRTFERAGLADSFCGQLARGGDPDPHAGDGTPHTHASRCRAPYTLRPR